MESTRIVCPYFGGISPVVIYDLTLFVDLLLKLRAVLHRTNEMGFNANNELPVHMKVANLCNDCLSFTITNKDEVN